MQRRGFIQSALLCAAAAMQGRAARAQSAGEHDILLGQSACLTGSFSEMGIARRDGARLYFDRINRGGGINGRRIRLVTLDDHYEPEKAAANTREFIDSQKVFALFGYTYASTVKAALPIATAAGVPFISPFTGYDELYATPPNPILFTTLASSSLEIQYLLKHAKFMNVKRIALVGYDSAPGRALEKFFIQKAGEAGLEQAGTASMVLDSGDAARAVDKISQADPDAILLGISGEDAIAFVRAYKKAKNNSYVQFLARSLVTSRQLVAELGDKSRGIVISELVPSPFNGTTTVAREYQKDIKAAQEAGLRHEASYESFEAYIAARVMTEALKRAGAGAGAGTDRRGFIDAFESIRDWDCGGFKLDFSRANHSGSSFVNITMIGRTGHFIE